MQISNLHQIYEQLLFLIYRLLDKDKKQKKRTTMSYCTEDFVFFKQAEREFNQNYRVVRHQINKSTAIKMIDERISALTREIADSWFACTKKTKNRKIDGLRQLKIHLYDNAYSLSDAVADVIQDFPTLSKGYVRNETFSLLSKLKTGYYETIEHR